MPSTNTCSFCLAKVDPLIFATGPRNHQKLVATLFLACNSDIVVRNTFLSCPSCNQLLFGISNKYFQLQKRLLKLKAVFLANLDKNRNSNYRQKKSRESLKLLVKDLNPSLVLSKIRDNPLDKEESEEACTPLIKIKQEDLDLEDNYYSEIGEIAPHPEFEVEVGGNFMDTDFHHDIDHSFSSPEWITEPNSSFSPSKIANNSPKDANSSSKIAEIAEITPPKRTSSRKSVKILPPPPQEQEQDDEKDPEYEESSESASSSEEEQFDEYDHAVSFPLKKTGLRKSKKRAPFLDEHGQPVELLPGENGSFSFSGIVMTRINIGNGKLARMKRWERNKFAKFRCASCSKIIQGVAYLKSHVLMVHLGLNKNGEPKKKKYDTVLGPDGKIRVIMSGIELVSTEDGQHQCGSCLETFPKMGKLVVHILRVHDKLPYPKPRKVFGPQIEVAANRVKRVKGEDGREFLCGVEIIRVQEQDGSINWKCGACDAASNVERNIWYHIKKRHPDSTPYRCEAPGCGEAFSRKNLLTSHKVRHMEERPFICDRCGVGCKRKESLNDHVSRVHLGKVNYQCPVSACAKQFFHRYDCIKHMRMHKDLIEIFGELKEIKL